MLLAVATLVTFTHSFEGGAGKRLDRAIEGLRPHQRTILASFGTPVRDSRLVLETSRQCKQVNSEFGIERPAWFDTARPGRIVLCEPFFRKSTFEMSVILGHELVHAEGGPSDAEIGPSHQQGSSKLSEIIRGILKGE